MTKQEIINTLAGIECALYYMADGSDDPQGLSTDDLWLADKKCRELMALWNKITGCILTD